MATDELEFLDRETLLGGGMAPGRRASALLFAIESRTARLVAQSQQATAWYLTRKAVAEREQEFFEALAEGRELPVAPTIQEIERYAANWTPLVADADAGLRRGVGARHGAEVSPRRERRARHPGRAGAGHGRGPGSLSAVLRRTPRLDLRPEGGLPASACAG